MIKHYFISLAVILTLTLAGCSEQDAERSPKVSIPDELVKRRPFEPRAVLAGISIQPEGSRLGNDELLMLSALFQQILAWAQAEGIHHVVLEKNMEIYKSLDPSLKNIPAWVELGRPDEVDLKRVVEIIETNVRRRK